MSDRRFTPARRRIIAHHEAGHAVANIVLKLRFIDVEVFERPTDGKGGRVQNDPDDAPLMIPQMIVMLAGPIAHERALKNPSFAQRAKLLLEDGHGDWLNAQRLAKELAQKNMPYGEEFFMNKAHDEATSLVADYWGWIERLADALIARGRLDYNAALMLVSSRG